MSFVIFMPGTPYAFRHACHAATYPAAARRTAAENRDQGKG
ncbi:MAG: hypothetical protein ACKOEM_15535 [Planctomycetia bacterium]